MKLIMQSVFLRKSSLPEGLFIGKHFIHRQFKGIGILLLLVQLCSASASFAQSSVYAGVGNLSGAGGNASVNIGEVLFLQANGSGGSMSSSILTPREVFHLSIDNYSTSETYSVFPNAVISSLFIASSANSNYQFNLFDMNGKLHFTSVVSESFFELDMSSYSSGVYVGKIISDNQVIQNIKIIKQ